MQRSQHRAQDEWDLEIEHPEQLLVVVVGLLLWIIGFVDLLSQTSQNGVVFGLYSVPYFLFLLVYAAGFIGWGALLVSTRLRASVLEAIGWIQQRDWLSLLVVAGSAVAIIFVAEFDRFPKYRAFQLIILLLIIIFNVVLLSVGWRERGRRQRWRKIVLSVVGLLLLTEGILQAFAFFGALPAGAVTADGVFTPYGRVYYNEQGSGNGRVNSSGWYYPEFELAEGSEKIILVGGESVKALQIEPERHMGVQLESALNADGATETATEVLGFGMHDYGPGLYVNPPLLEYVLNDYRPQEIIVLLNLDSDFRYVAEPRSDALYYQVDDDGRVELHPSGYLLRHDWQHIVLRNFEPPVPVEILKSYLLTPKLAAGLLDSPSATVQARETEMGEAPSDREIAITLGLLGEGYDYLQEQGVQMRIVTLPVFPDAIDADNNLAWGFAAAEEAVAAFARQRDIPMLALGAHLEASAMTADEIAPLYYANGAGYLTPMGHQYVADIVYDCFFDDALAESPACYQPRR